MPRYEVKFYITVPEVLTPEGETEIAHTVHHRVSAGVIPCRIKPDERKVYIQRKYSPQEEMEIVHKHASVDVHAGRDWNTSAGCTCEVCSLYRKMGASIT